MISSERVTLVVNLALIIGGLIAVIALCGTVLVGLLVWRTGGSDVGNRDLPLIRTFVEQGMLLQIFTAMAVVISAILLRILDMINGEAAVSLLSGVAGYVFGGLTRRAQSSR